MNHPNQIFDHHILNIRSKRYVDQKNFLADHCAENIQQRLNVVKKPFNNPLLIGTQSEFFTSNFQAIINTLDTKALPVEANRFDLIISNLQLHKVNDVPGLLKQIHHLLKPNGLFIAALLGGNTLQELRQAFINAECAYHDKVSPRISPFIDLATASSLLSRINFNQPVADRQQLTVTYQDPWHLMHELRSIGESNILSTRSKAFTPRSIFYSMANEYQQKFSTEEQRIRATFEIIYLTGWSN